MRLPKYPGIEAVTDAVTLELKLIALRDDAAGELYPSVVDRSADCDGKCLGDFQRDDWIDREILDAAFFRQRAKRGFVGILESESERSISAKAKGDRSGGR